MLNYQNKRKNCLFTKFCYLASSLICFLQLPLTYLLFAHCPFDYLFKTDNSFEFNRKRNRIRIAKNPIRYGLKRIPDSPKYYSSHT